MIRGIEACLVFLDSIGKVVYEIVQQDAYDCYPADNEAFFFAEMGGHKVSWAQMASDRMSSSVVSAIARAVAPRMGLRAEPSSLRSFLHKGR